MREPGDDNTDDEDRKKKKKKQQQRGRHRHRAVKEKSKAEGEAPEETTTTTTTTTITTSTTTTMGEATAPSRLVTRSYSEAVLIARETGVVERSYLSECTYAAQQRFKELIQCERRMMPSRFSSTIVLWSQSNRRRFKDTVLFLPRLQAKSYSETIYTFAKDTCHVFTSTLTQYTSREKSRWYTSAIELQPGDDDDGGATTSDAATSQTSQDETESS